MKHYRLQQVSFCYLVTTRLWLREKLVNGICQVAALGLFVDYICFFAC